MYDHIRDWPAVEFTLGIIIGIIYLMMWNYRVLHAEEADGNERQLGASVAVAQLNGIILASTIAFGLLAHLAVLTLDDRHASVEANAHLFNAGVAMLAAILCALWALGLISYHVTKRNVVKCRDVMLVAAAAFCFFVAAIVRLGLAIWNVLA